MFANLTKFRVRVLLACWLILAWSISTVSLPHARAQEEDQVARTGRLLTVDLPLTSKVTDRLIQQIRELRSQMPVAVRAEDRSVLVLEFDTNSKTSGQGSDFWACGKLADYLTGPEMKSIRTVAWIPSEDSVCALVGHAVLVAVSCSELAMSEQSLIGKANLDNEIVTQNVKQTYQEMAEKRRTLPPSLVLGMLGSDEPIERVTTATQTIFATQSQREAMQADKDVDVKRFRLISAAETATFLSGEQLSELRLVRNLYTSRADLARRFNISISQLSSAAENDRSWNALEYKLPSRISESEVSWLSRAINRKLIGKTDMVMLEFGETDGDSNASLRLAEYLASLDDDTRTVAWVSGRCEGLTGIAALACDEVFFGPEGKLGLGEDSEIPSPRELESFEITIRAVARETDRDWSTLMALVNPKMVIHEYRHINTAARRLMGKAEYDELPELESAQWVAAEKQNFAAGIDADLAKEIGIANDQVAQSMEVVKSRYVFESEPESIEPTATERWLEEFASFLTNPAVSMMLLFGAFVCFMNELSAPGLGVFGFLAVVLLSAFFWSHHLEGNAEWFEILLFVVGVLFIAAELFIVPGFGIFGIGGILMVVLSLVLAGQDFVVPATDQQFETFTWSLLPLLGAFMGIVIGTIVLQKVLPNSPLFQRFALQAPEAIPANLDGSDPEATADWSYLAGQKGDAVTKIMPSGKAKIDGRVYNVISDGEIIDKGDTIEVVEAVANRVVVRKI